MKPRAAYELPEHQEQLHRRAVRLEWWTIGLLGFGAALMYAVAGSSQAMKTAWVEDVLSLVPPIAYLVADRVRKRRPSERFPYGHQRAISIAFLCSAVALFGMGSFLLIESALKLLAGERAAIGAVQVLGQDIWLGWLMLPALVVTGIIPIVLGRLKLPLAREVHDKALHADAEMNKADWLTAAAGIVGIVGVGFGFWWADAAAALVIAFEITRDGAENLKRVVLDLMDRAPTSVEGDMPDGIADDVVKALERLEWVNGAEARLREEGEVLAGEAFVVPRDEHSLLQRLEQATAVAKDVHWRIGDIVVTAVAKLE